MYAYVCMICLPLILLALLVYWWIRRRRQRQKDVLDATRPGKLHLFAVDEGTSTFTATPQSISILRPPSGELDLDDNQSQVSNLSSHTDTSSALIS